MEKALKAKWIEALRSGEYKQGRCKLRPSPSEYCCLGVLCDVSHLGHWRDVSLGSLVYSYGDSCQLSDLGSALLDDIGITSQEETTLMTLNDSERLDFFAIADWIAIHVKEDQ